MKRAALIAAIAALGLAAVPAAAKFKDPPSWTQPAKPFRIVGNVWYVGTEGLAAYLIRTPKGAILIDAGLDTTAHQVEANIKALGVRLKDVKVLLNSHAHFDHAGGLAKLKADTGARLIVHPGDRPALEAGNYPGWEEKHEFDFPKVKVDRTIRYGEKVVLGGVALTAVASPGHTEGCTAWTLQTAEAGRRHTVFFDCSTSVAANRLFGTSQYPGIIDDYRTTFARLKAVKADVFLAPHPETYGMAGKRAKIAPGAPNPFVVPGELQAYIAKSEKAFEAALARQKAESGARK